MVSRFIRIVTLALAVTPTGSALAQDPDFAHRPLSVGSPAPDFEATDDRGKPWRSSDHVGRKILVAYFFPGDFITSCTRQAIQFSNDLAELTNRGIELVGISGDSVATHQLFKVTHDLKFTLLSDEQGDIARKFGVRVSAGGSIRRPRIRQQTLYRKATLARRFFAINLEGKIVDNRPRVARLADIDIVFDQLAKDFWRNREDKEAGWIPTVDRDWKRLLTREQYLVTRRKHTERAFSGEYNVSQKKGRYRCIGCGQVLFEAGTKFQSGTGWPSFWSPASTDCLTLAPDRSDRMIRTEVKCRRCDGHLGHVFLDGPPPTGHRYCINSAALAFDLAVAEIKR